MSFEYRNAIILSPSASSTWINPKSKDIAFVSLDAGFGLVPALWNDLIFHFE